MPGPITKQVNKMIKAPQAAEAATPEAPSTPRFTLSTVVTSPTKHKVLTTLPLAEFLEKLQVGPTLKLFADTINSGIRWIYKHVTMRNPEEETDHFFVHIAATVIYENKTHTFIKGKCHPKNAASILNIIEPTLKTITGVLERYALTKDERETLTLVKNIYIVSINAIYEALQEFNKTNPTLIQQLLENDKVNVLAYKPLPLTAEESAALLKIFPQTAGTPKRKTAETKQSVAVLNGNNRGKKPRKLKELLGEPLATPSSAAQAAQSSFMQVSLPEDSFESTSLRNSLAGIFQKSSTMTWMFETTTDSQDGEFTVDLHEIEGDKNKSPDSDSDPDSDLDSALPPPPNKAKSRFF